MIARRLMVGLAAATAVAAPSAAVGEADADPCASEASELAGPLLVGLFEGDVGTPLRACPHSELAVGARGAALIDEPNFFGTIDAALRIGGSYRYGESGELVASVEIPRFRFVQNATLTGTTFDLGWASMGATHGVTLAPSLRVAATGRLSVPAGASSYESARPLYGELGAATQWDAWRSLSVHGYASGLVGAALGRGPTGARAGLLMRAGATYRLGRVGLVVGGDGLAGYGAALDHLAVTPGLRVRAWRALTAELAASLPVAGATRTDLAAALNLSWRP